MDLINPKIKNIITPSHSSKEGIIKEFDCSKDAVTVINNGLDTDEFSPIESVTPDPFRLITTASADVPLKGLDYSLRGLKLLKKEFPKIHLIVIGKIKEGGHTERLIRKLNISDSQLKEAIDEISRLNPKPGGSISSEVDNNTITPDFILTIQDGNLMVEINKRNAPELKLSNSYKEMLAGYKNDPNKKKSQNDAIQFIKQKLDSAKWFIDAIAQREQTLLLTINAIIDFQKDYFLTGEEKLIKPMILKDIAEELDMDISTISRSTRNKYVDTPYGIFELKSFFSGKLNSPNGEEVSVKLVKNLLKQLIHDEVKQEPLTDTDLAIKLKEKGYPIARRTVEKYREELKLPVARLRRQLTN